jgi:hypothetical protein
MITQQIKDFPQPKTATNGDGKMNNDMKCPFCQQELRNCCAGVIYTCSKPDSCPHEQCYGSKELWQGLIHTRKALDVATGFIKGISQTVINDCDNQYVVLGNFKKFAQDTLNQIKKALEEKDVK